MYIDELKPVIEDDAIVIETSKNYKTGNDEINRWVKDHFLNVSHIKIRKNNPILHPLCSYLIEVM
jgi:hypothetical protein